MTKNSIQHSPLGEKSEYCSTYAPELLFPIARVIGRTELGIDPEALPFYGTDLWTAYEISWLNQNGKPQVALAEIQVPSDSNNIVESKSLKLYFNSFNQTKFNSIQEVKNVIESDLSACAESQVEVELGSVNENVAQLNEPQDYACIDDIDVEISEYLPDSSLLIAASDEVASEKLVTHLLKSNCPVTGQPDWASLFVDYVGPKIEHASLLSYVISYREHMGFHEQCVEQIFIDLMQQCEPHQLTVSARYLRRGGLDINPIRSTQTEFAKIGRLIRQ